jgi:ferric-dicitrate binding protein FerR (iron transport regulator)
MDEKRQAQTQGSGSDDRLEELLRLAGRREPIPAERTERVRAAVHAEWQARVRSRRRTRALWGLAAAAVVTLAVGIPAWRTIVSGPETEPTVGRVVTVSRTAWSRSPATGGEVLTSRLRNGQVVVVGEELSTDEGRVALRLDSGTSVRLDEHSRLRVLAANELALDRGTVYVDSGPEEGRVAVEIHTSAGVIRDIGTQFEVRARDDAIRIRVREGAVVMRTSAGDHRVDHGNEIQVDAAGDVARQPIPIFGPDWGWLADVTPMMRLEGRSAREFLDWVARESGWELRFASESVEISASRIAVSGSVDHLSLDQVLDAVLPTCQMTYQVTDGVLLVDAIGPA